MAFTSEDAVRIVEYNSPDPSKGGSGKYTMAARSSCNSSMYNGFLLADYTISGSKPSHTVIRAAGTQQTISALDDIQERELTLPMVFISTPLGRTEVEQWKALTNNISIWTKILMNGGEPIRIALREDYGLQFVGRLTDISETENIIPNGTMRAITYTLTGYLTSGLKSTYHTSYTQGVVDGTAPKIMACVDFKKSASYSGAWILGTRITGLTDYVYLRFDGINKQILGAKEPASGESITWENIMQKVESSSFNGFPCLEGGGKYKLAELPAVGLAKNGSATTSMVSTAWTIYDAILI